MDELTQYINEESIRGDIARELVGIISDYQASAITEDEKVELVKACYYTFEQSEAAQDEVLVRWVVSAVRVAASVA